MSRCILLFVCAVALFGLVSASALETPLEGRACRFQTWNGVCTSGACTGGQKLVGKCAGGPAIQCCIRRTATPAAAAGARAGAAARPAAPAPTVASPAASRRPAETRVTDSGASAKSNGIIGMDTPFPYTFPYSTGRHIVVDFTKQRARLYDGTTALREYKISSGVRGVGTTPEVPATPSGKLRVSQKVGTGKPLGMIFEKLTPKNKIGLPSDSHAHMQTRILVLEGMDASNRNTRSRSIYFHGTNREANLGNMASHGCFRMGNNEIKELYDLVAVNTPIFAAPKNAWPESSVVANQNAPVSPPSPIAGPPAPPA